MNTWKAEFIICNDKKVKYDSTSGGRLAFHVKQKQTNRGKAVQSASVHFECGKNVCMLRTLNDKYYRFLQFYWIAIPKLIVNGTGRNFAVSGHGLAEIAHDKND